MQYLTLLVIGVEWNSDIIHKKDNKILNYLSQQTISNKFICIPIPENTIVHFCTDSTTKEIAQGLSGLGVSFVVFEKAQFCLPDELSNTLKDAMKMLKMFDTEEGKELFHNMQKNSGFQAVAREIPRPSLDELLDKVAMKGMNALSALEQKWLKELSKD